jgi:hypothetical protein
LEFGYGSNQFFETVRTVVSSRTRIFFANQVMSRGLVLVSVLLARFVDPAGQRF